MQHIEKPGDNDKKTDKPRSVYIATYGCQMNLRDSEAIKGLLLEDGFEITGEEKEADAILFVTCSVRQHAEDKVWSEIGRITKERRRAPAIKGQSPSGTVPAIGLIGCMAENYKDAAFKRMPGIDLVVGTNNIGEIPGLLRNVFNESQTTGDKRRPTKEDRQFLAVSKKERDEFVYDPAFREENENSFVVISEGCDNFCSYCVVPYVRGRLRHRKPEHILKEIKHCIKRGTASITLLGQNVNSYTYEKTDFLRLLRLVDSVKGLKEFNFVTSHPKNASAGLFQVMAQMKRLKKYLHLPFQSGSNRILKIMRRGYSSEHYLDLARQYRRIIPDGELSTDVIVGFPGETEEDFLETKKLLEAVRFNNAYIFKYSPRPNTKALKLKDDVLKEEKERRHRIILETQKRISKELKTKK